MITVTNEICVILSTLKGICEGLQGSVGGSRLPMGRCCNNLPIPELEEDDSFGTRLLHSIDCRKHWLAQNASHRTSSTDSKTNGDSPEQKTFSTDDTIEWIIVWPWEPHCVYVLTSSSTAVRPAQSSESKESHPVASASTGFTTHVFLPDSNQDRYLLTDNIEALAWAQTLSRHLAVKFTISCIFRASSPPNVDVVSICPAFFIAKASRTTNDKRIVLSGVPSKPPQGLVTEEFEKLLANTAHEAAVTALETLYSKREDEIPLPKPSETLKPNFELIIVPFIGASFRVQCSLNDSIAAIKGKIKQYNSEMTPRRQQLFYGGQTLKPGKVLADYQVPNGSILHLWDRAWTLPLMGQSNNADESARVGALVTEKEEKQVHWESILTGGQLPMALVSYAKEVSVPKKQYECIVCYCIQNEENIRQHFENEHKVHLPRIDITVIKAYGLQKIVNNEPDASVRVALYSRFDPLHTQKRAKGRTDIRHNSRAPVWNRTFNLDPQRAEYDWHSLNVFLKLRDNHPLGLRSVLGTLEFRLGLFAQGSRTAKWMLMDLPEGEDDASSRIWLKLNVFWETSAYIAKRLIAKNDETSKWLRQIQLEKQVLLLRQESSASSSSSTSSSKAENFNAVNTKKELSPSPDFSRYLVPLHCIPDVWHAAVPVLSSSTEAWGLHAALICLKDLYYHLQHPRWFALRDRLQVGFIKDSPTYDDAEYGTYTYGNTSVSMGLAGKMWSEEKRKPLVFVNCGNSIKYQIYEPLPDNKLRFTERRSKFGLSPSNMSVPSINYQPPDTVRWETEASLTEHFKTELEEFVRDMDGLVKKKHFSKMQNEPKSDEKLLSELLREDSLPFYCFVTGPIRGYWANAERKEKTILEEVMNNMFSGNFVDLRKIKDSYFLDQQHEGKLELKAAQMMYENMVKARFLNEKCPPTPVATLGIGVGSASFSHDDFVIESPHGMSDVYQLAKLGDQVLSGLRVDEDQKNSRMDKFLTSLEKIKNFPVIALKSGCLTYFQKINEVGGDLFFEKVQMLTRKLEGSNSNHSNNSNNHSSNSSNNNSNSNNNARDCNDSMASSASAISTALSSSEANSSIRVFVGQNGVPEFQRVVWRLPSNITLPRMCADVACLLKVRADFLIVFHENGSRIDSVMDIRDGDGLFFSCGEAFDAPPSLPALIEALPYHLATFPLMQLAWVRDRWLIARRSMHAILASSAAFSSSSNNDNNNSNGNYLSSSSPRAAHSSSASKKDLLAQTFDAALNFPLSVFKDFWMWENERWKLLRWKVFIQLPEIEGERFHDEKQTVAELFLRVENHKIAFVFRDASTKCSFEFSGTNGAALLKNIDDESQAEERRKFLFVLSETPPPVIFRVGAGVLDTKEKKYKEMRDLLTTKVVKNRASKRSIRLFFGKPNSGGILKSVRENWTVSRLCAEAPGLLDKPGANYTRVFTSDGCELIQHDLSPAGHCLDDHLVFTRGEDFGEVLDLTHKRILNVPAFPSLSLRKLSELDLSTATVVVNFDFALLVPKSYMERNSRGVLESRELPKSIRDAFLQDELTLLFNNVPLRLSNPKTHSQGLLFEKAKYETPCFHWTLSSGEIRVPFAASDQALHEAIKDCPFDEHRLDFVAWVRPVEVPTAKLFFNFHYSETAFTVVDRVGADYLAEFDVDWLSGKVRLATGLPELQDERGGISDENTFGYSKLSKSLTPFRADSRQSAYTATLRMNKEPRSPLPPFLCLDPESKEPGGICAMKPCDCIASQIRLPGTFIQNCVNAKCREGLHHFKQPVFFCPWEPSLKRRCDKDHALIRNGQESHKGRCMDPCAAKQVWCETCGASIPLVLAFSCGKCPGKDYCKACVFEQPFQIVQYSVIIRRDPLLLFCVAVIPIFVLMFFTLSIQWQGGDLNGALQNIGTILLAQFAYAPTIRDKLPPSPVLTKIDWVLNFGVGFCLAVLIYYIVMEFFDFEEDSWVRAGTSMVLGSMYLGLILWMTCCYILNKQQTRTPAAVTCTQCGATYSNRLDASSFRWKWCCASRSKSTEVSPGITVIGADDINEVDDTFPSAPRRIALTRRNRNSSTNSSNSSSSSSSSNNSGCRSSTSAQGASNNVNVSRVASGRSSSTYVSLT